MLLTLIVLLLASVAFDLNKLRSDIVALCAVIILLVLVLPLLFPF